jgi:hypothetical protein
VLKVLAVIPSAIDVEPIIIHANYINIVKFALKEDSGYRSISGYLRVISKDTSGAVVLR